MPICIDSNIKKYSLLIVLVLTVVLVAISQDFSQNKNTKVQMPIKADKLPKSDSEWRKVLSPEQFRVLREKGTERPHTGEYNLHFEKGEYSCAGCGEVLFTSEDKFESHCGWPSFSDLKDKSKIQEIMDYSFGMVRTEVVCANCGGHLGHLFDDGPAPTGLRYCINSVSLQFKAQDSTKKGE